MNANPVKNKSITLLAVLVVCTSLVGCVVVEEDGYDYRTQQQKDDDMAKEAMHDSMKSLSKEDKKALRKLGK